MRQPTLGPGHRLGPYEITGAIGEGGMGEVYKARDTRLNRTVAVKVLRRDLVKDAAGRARFEREARAISALDHPNICVLHDVGAEDDVEFLVMQYLEGDTLAARLARGPLPLDEALRYGIDIASALDRAHHAGILHRDLKPGNIMLARSGRETSAKLLDFGLAKLAPAGGPAAALHTQATATSPLTGQGAILGTLLYMSPEQLQGAELDARSDIFSFGAVLYEMVTGARAFAGASQVSVIGAILEREPPSIASRAPLTPPALERVVRKCIAKDPERRWQSATDLRDELAWIADSISTERTGAVGAVRTQPRVRWALPLALVTIAALAGTLVWTLVQGRETRGTNETPRFLNIAVPEGMRLAAGGIAISPDGKTIAYAAATAAVAEPNRPSTAVSSGKLFLRRFDRSESTVVPGSDGARSPFFSPDSSTLAFFSETKLMKLSLVDGSLVKLADVPPVTRGGAFLSADTIVVAPTQNSGLVTMPASGGQVTPLIDPDLKAGEKGLGWPTVLPNGQVLYTIRRGTPSNEEDADLGIFDPLTKKRTVILQRAAYGRYSPTGELLFVRGRALMRVALDLSKPEVSGTPQRVTDATATHPWLGGGHFAVAPDGALVLAHGSWGTVTTTTLWMDRSGRPAPGVKFSENEIGKPRLSPDGTRAVIDAVSSDGDSEIYIADVARGTTVRFTNNPEDDFNPVWTADGQRIIWTTMPSGKMPALVWRAADGTGQTETIYPLEGAAQFAGSVSREGIFAFAQWHGGRGCDIWAVPLAGERKARPFITGPGHDYGPEFSPDGKWVAYVSDESGALDVYIVPYPGPGGKRRVTSGGGASPAWSRDGRELYYMSSAGLMVTPVLDVATMRFGQASLLFKGDFVTNSREDGPREYDVAEGAKRFLMVQATKSNAAPVSLDVLSNWWLMDPKK